MVKILLKQTQPTDSMTANSWSHDRLTPWQFLCILTVQTIQGKKHDQHRPPTTWESMVSPWAGQGVMFITQTLQYFCLPKPMFTHNLIFYIRFSVHLLYRVWTLTVRVSVVLQCDSDHVLLACMRYFCEWSPTMCISCWSTADRDYHCCM